MEMNVLKPALISLAAALTLAPAALAAPITPEAAAEVLRAAGDTEVTVNDAGDTAVRIDANRGGVFYSVRLFSCDEARSCVGVMIFATYAEPGALDLSVYERNNQYNDSFPFGRGFLLPGEEGDGTYTIGLDYSLDIGGEANFDNDDVDLFFGALDAYVTHMESPE
jgi:hypothetical protein